MTIGITNENITAKIDLMGAELVSLLHHGHERLWQNETGAWAGHAPVLFPLCGNCAMTVGGKTYPIARHGFARKSLFTVTEQREDGVKLSLNSSAETRKAYPFTFGLGVTYEIRGNLLEIGYEIENRGRKPMPFSCGGHLSHALSEPVGEHFIRFDKEEDFQALLHDENGLLTGETSDMGRGKELRLKEEYFKGGSTVILGGVRSASATLFSEKRGALAELGFAGFENVLLWKPENGNMLCIEPWKNLPDRIGDGREFCAKRGVETLGPGERTRIVQTVTYY